MTALVSPPEQVAASTVSPPEQVAASTVSPPEQVAASTVSPPEQVAAAIELLSHLRTLDVRLWVSDGDRLRFSAPDGVMTPELRARIGAYKAELIAFLRESQATAQQGAPTITPVARTGELPLSFAQQRLWFLDQLEPGNPTYNVPMTVALTGSLHVAALEAAFNEIVQRHEVLRTTFQMNADGRPVLKIAPSLTVPLHRIDLEGWAKAASAAEVERLAAAEAKRPFDLAHGPLVRTTLLRLGGEEHIFLLTMHHIVSDGWSMGVLTREMAMLYATFAQGRPSPLPPLPIQYTDFAYWQRQWLQGAVREQQLAYWRKQLAGAPAVLDLPTDRPRPAVQSYRGAQEPLALSQSLTEALKLLGRGEDATLFMTLLAAYQVLLYHYTGQDDIPVGATIANRNRAEIEGLIGFFVNTLVLRTDLATVNGVEPSFREVLRRVRSVALGAFAHQDLPFEHLVDELHPERTLSYSPLFQAAFQLQGATRSETFQLPGLTLRLLTTESTTAKFDLFLSLADGPDGLAGSLEYNTDIFDATTIRRMLAHFKLLLARLVAAPDEPIAAISFLPAPELHQLLVTWNDNRLDYPRHHCIHEGFEAQVERTPDAIAVWCGGQQLSYHALNQRANQVARYLRKLGVGSEVLVGICHERTLDLVVAMLGVLKAGGAYVPLDPAYPAERLAFILEDAQAPVVLTQQRLLEQGMSGAGESLADAIGPHCRVVCLDRDWATIAAERTANPTSGVRADNASDLRPAGQSLAYVIYTSGSTGRPKGVAIEHRSAVALIHWASTIFTPADLAGVLASTSICFDLSVFELFVTLTWGGKVILVENALQLPALPEASEVTLVNTVPSAMAELVRQGELPASVRTVNLAGEPLQTRLVQEIYRQGTVKQVFDLYGPSEDTTYSTFALRSATERATIGRPIANTQVYLLNRHLQPVPSGVVGELYLGGDGLARGYLNRPELTAERFIPDLFSKTPGARLYRTGDLARYLPDPAGAPADFPESAPNLEFLGRRDHQVKIRGFRIELGEIQAVLVQHPAVHDAIVVAWEETPGEKRLVAYVATGQGAAPSVSELRGYLLQKLPSYMAPAAFVFLEALPQTPNGKIDRKALPIPDQARPDLDSTFLAPRTPEEEILAGIWAQVLSLEQVGVQDNFFELGGDSIQSIQVVARANQAGLRLTPAQLFQHPTVEGLAQVADTAAPVQAEQGLVTGPAPLTPIQHWFFAQQLPDLHHWNWAFLQEVRQPLEPRLLEQTLHHLLAHHDALRLRFHSTDAGWQQMNAGMEEETPFTLIDLSALAPEEQRAAITATAAQLQRRLNLADGPLLRVAYFDLGAAQPARVLILFHHLVVDGISVRVLMEDLHLVYQQLRHGEAVRLPPKTTSFQQWAQRLLDYAQSSQLREELPYWLAHGQRRVQSVPLDYPHKRAENSVASARTVAVALDAEETQALLQEAPQAYHTQINDILLTALVETLTDWTTNGEGSRTLLLDLEGHGREDLFADIDLSRTVGWFTSIFPVILDLEGVSDPGTALKSIKEQLRSIPNRGIGYGLLRYLCPEQEVRAQLQALPQAEVNFNYLGQFGRMDQTQTEEDDAMASLFGPAREATGPLQCPTGRRNYLIEIVSSVTGGRLHVNWTYSEQLHQRATIEQVAQQYLTALRRLIAHCQSPEAGGFTPSDFSLLTLDQGSLDKILGKVKIGAK